MNLIQQAVERAVQLEQQGICVTPPLPTVARPDAVQPLTLQPQRRRGFAPVLAAVLLAAVALGGGALLYVLLVKTQSLGNSGGTAVTTPKPTPIVTTEPVAAPASSVVEPAATVAVAAASTIAVAAVAEPASASASVPAPAATSVPLPAPAAAPAPTASDEARLVVERWARAWSERDVAAYLELYGEGFAPGKGLSRHAWEMTRRQMIERRNSIQVTVNDLRLDTVSEDQVTARFRQDYAADTYRESAVPKRLVLAREASGWRIVSETADVPKSGTL